MGIIELKNINFEYENNNPVINNVSLSIEKGEYVTLIGRNGSGKSTLAKLIGYLSEPKSGSIFINGLEANEKNSEAIREVIGIVFQNPDNQFIGSTVEDDVAFGLENRNIEREKMIFLVKEFAKKVGMEKFLDKEPSELSGGQKQRVALAGILSLGLKIIILDESTAMLDPEGVEDIKKLINEMRKDDPSLTFISITHDMEEAFLSDRVILLSNGEILLDGKPEEVFKNETIILENGLDLPFCYKIINKLNEENIKINESVKSSDSLVEYLCKLK